MPYAAKAKIEHEFDTDHLNIWLTFQHRMRIKATPATTLFTAILDNVDYVIASAVWQDRYTLLLVVNSVASDPARLLVKYEGPTQNLETAWRKQWEPWGPILSLDITT